MDGQGGELPLATLPLQLAGQGQAAEAQSRTFRETRFSVHVWRLVGNRRVFLELPCIFGRSVSVSSIPSAAVGRRRSQAWLPFAAGVQTVTCSSFSKDK